MSWGRGETHWPKGGDWTDWKKNGGYLMELTPAPTGRATCKFSACKRGIAKGCLRVYLSCPPFENDDHGGPSMGSYHLKCFVESQRRFAKNGVWQHFHVAFGHVTKPSKQLLGFEDLPDEIQAKIEQLFAAALATKPGAGGASSSPAAGPAAAAPGHKQMSKHSAILRTLLHKLIPAPVVAPFRCCRRCCSCSFAVHMGIRGWTGVRLEDLSEMSLRTLWHSDYAGSAAYRGTVLEQQR